jgi:UDP-N-acetylglucosamine 2-epimerase (non-hydrolysing)
MTAFEATCLAERPDIVIVVGDVNSTLAAALVAAKLQIPITHVEAGLRSGDWTMPEEVNRVVTDRLSNLLLTTEREAEDRLDREGIPRERVHFVGNVMIDSLLTSLARAPAVEATLSGNGASAAFMADAVSKGFGLVTLHRPSNVDEPVRLAELLATLAEISGRLPLVFAIHPRTRARIAESGLEERLKKVRILTTPPLPYLQTISLMKGARLVITDSGGVQEETTALGVPCLTARDTTERPVTITEGTNTLIGLSTESLKRGVVDVLETGGKRGRVPELWDGRAAERVTQRIAGYLAARARTA